MWKKIIKFVQYSKKDWLITIIIALVLLVLITIAILTLSNPLIIYNILNIRLVFKYMINSS